MSSDDSIYSQRLREMNEALLLSSIRQDELADQYEQAMQTLAEQDRRKDEFLAMLSHELRNPLAPIANAVQILRLIPDESPLQREARNIIERQTGLLARLVDDLMEISRIRTGRVLLRLEHVEISGIITRAVQSTQPHIDRHRHQLETVIPDAAIWVNADPARLEQIIVNLLNNAVKYTPDGGMITLSLQATPRNECVLCIRDTGIGIAPELLPRIFDLFTQAERSLDRAQGGLGIGLALVQRLVELHHGRIETRSAVGIGSEFYVYLPLVLPMSNVATTSTIKVRPQKGAALRIMVVDDNIDAAESLSGLLTTLGHEVRTAYNGFDGIALANAFQPDAAILDIGLPELDGYQVAQRIREQLENRDVLLIALTGYGQAADRQRSMEAGLNHHLVKPTDFQQLLEILESIGERRATERY